VQIRYALTQGRFLTSDFTTDTILSDPIPECHKLEWPTTDPGPAVDPPSKPTTYIFPIYNSLVPRIPPSVTSSRYVSSIPEAALASYYQTFSSTATCLYHAQRTVKNEIYLEAFIF
jgi:hypothetical protein